MALKVALALSGLEPEQWNDDFNELYRDKALMFSYSLPKSPSTSSVASTCSYYSMESGISSMSPDSVSYQHILSRSNFETLLLDALKKHTEINFDNPSSKLEEDIETASVPHKPSEKILYGGRNLLDLASNITGGWKYQTAELPDGVGSYFENRSQYSRLQGALPPHHTKAICSEKDCSFFEPIYF